MKEKKGFTVLEIILCIVFVGVFVILFFTQKGNIEAMNRDDDRKTAINAMYYALEEGYYNEKGYYPEHIKSAADLPWIDPNLFTDPRGFVLWNEKDGSDYHYEASKCKDGKCESYSLRARMEKEDDFVRTSRH